MNNARIVLAHIHWVSVSIHNRTSDKTQMRERNVDRDRDRERERETEREGERDTMWDRSQVMSERLFLREEGP